MANIVDLEVMCGKRHMEVAVTFDKPFNGIIFSKVIFNFCFPKLRITASRANSLKRVTKILLGDCIILKGTLYLCFLRRVPWIATIAFTSSPRRVRVITNSILCTTSADPSRTWTGDSTRTTLSFSTTRTWLRSGTRPSGCAASGTMTTRKEWLNLPSECPI